MQVFPWVCQLGGDPASPWDCPWDSQRPAGASPHPAPASTKSWRWLEESVVTLPQQAGRRESLYGNAQEELHPVGGHRDSWSGWPKQESGPFLDVHKSGLVVNTLPLNTGKGWGRHLTKCFSLRAKNGIGWLMNSVQAWQLTAGEKTCELWPSVPRTWKFQPRWVGPLLRLQCWAPVFLFIVGGPAQTATGGGGKTFLLLILPST